MNVFDNNWDFKIDLIQYEQKNYRVFADTVKNIDAHVLQLLDSNFVNKSSNEANSAQNFDYDLKTLIEINRQLKDKIKGKVQDLETRQKQYENFKQDRKLLSQEIKDTHEAFLMAKKYYKKYLKLYYTIESEENNKQKILVQFFTETRKMPENYSVWLLRDMKTGKYELAEMVPKLSIYKDIQKKLQETNDIPGALASIRHAFLNIRNK